jgi:hypothetical protein
MPFIENADTPSGRRWVSERDTIWMQDPLRRASETLARDLETYLYDETDPKYRDIHFLMWAIARYDVAKTGSGRYADTVDYDPTEALKEGIPDPKDRRGNPGNYSEIDVRFPRHAKDVMNHDELPAAGDKDSPDTDQHARPDLPSGVKDGRSLKPASPSGDDRDTEGFQFEPAKDTDGGPADDLKDGDE